MGEFTRERRRTVALLPAAALVLVALLAAGSAITVRASSARPAVGRKAPATGFPVRLRDAMGDELVIPALPRRIVSLAPSVTEILFALGLDRELVGISDGDDYPPERVATKTRVGGVIVSVERVTALQPDLVVGMPSLQRDQLTRLKAGRLRVLAVDAMTITETLAQIRLLGRVTGRPRQAETLAGQIERQAAAVRPTVRRSVYVEVWHEPLIAAAGATLIDDLVRRAGGANIFADLRGYPQVSAEIVITRDPQVILLLYDAGGGVAARPGWRNVEAVRTGRIFTLPTSLAARPGPRIAQGLALVSRALQGMR